MAGYGPDEPIYNSYVEAYLAGNKLNIPADAGSRTSTAHYGYGPSASAQRLRRAKNFAEGSPTPVKTISVLQRPTKAPSAKNAENLDVQHERDKAAFQRRAMIYQQHAARPYHHHAVRLRLVAMTPPGSILTTFEQGHIVDRGRRKCYVQEARGVYDPVVHHYRIEPAPEVAAAAAAKERPCSAPHKRAAIQQEAKPHHSRSTTPFEHKLLQVSRGKYNPLTHEYIDKPEPEYAKRKEKEFERVHGLGQGLRRVQQPQQGTDPINWDKEKPSSSSSASAPELSTGSSEPEPSANRRQRPTSAPTSMRKPMSGPSWGTYNPLTHEWSVPPKNPEYEQQDTLLHRRMGISGSSVGRTATPWQQGVYNPILNTWTVPPANPRHIEGLTFMPATLFSKPTPATIRM